MRVILVPLFGDRHDRTALAAAYTIAQPFRSHRGCSRAAC